MRLRHQPVYSILLTCGRYTGRGPPGRPARYGIREDLRRAMPPCERPVSVVMTGRGGRLVVKRNASGFPRVNACGNMIRGHRLGAPHGLRTGDAVRVNREEFETRRRVCMLRTARFDGRCQIETASGAKFNVMASTLTLIHRGCGARVR